MKPYKHRALQTEVLRHIIIQTRNKIEGGKSHSICISIRHQNFVLCHEWSKMAECRWYRKTLAIALVNLIEDYAGHLQTGRFKVPRCDCCGRFMAKNPEGQFVCTSVWEIDHSI